MRLVPPSPWQRKMDANHEKVQSSKVRQLSGARAKKEHVMAVCGSDTLRKITLSPAPEPLTAVGTGPAFFPSQM